MIFRIFARGSQGEIRSYDYSSEEALLVQHTKVGIDDCSTDLSLRGLPVFLGLIGPMPESEEGIVRYETPEVFEKLTQEWCKPRRRSRVAGRCRDNSSL